jgi:hypothetical protein
VILCLVTCPVLALAVFYLASLMGASLSRAELTIRVIVDLAGSLRTMRFAGASDLTVAGLRAAIARTYCLEASAMHHAVLKYKNDCGNRITFWFEAELKEALVVSERRGKKSLVRVSVTIPTDPGVRELMSPSIIVGWDDIGNIEPTRPSDNLSSPEKIHEPSDSHSNEKSANSEVFLELEHMFRNFFELDGGPISGGSRRSINCGNGSKRRCVEERGECLPRLLRTIQIDKLGQCFKFVNREEQCMDLLRMIARLDTMRGYKEFDVVKRDIIRPTCLGMPGTGKTRFSRVAVRTALECILQHSSHACAHMHASVPPRNEEDEINSAIPELVR